MTTPCSYCGGKVVDDVCEDCGKPAKKVSLVTANMGGLDAPAAELVTTASSTHKTQNSRRFTVNYPTRAGATAGTGRSRRRPGVSTSTSVRRNALGGGLISLPEMPSQDPLKLLMADPKVPANKRHCAKCDTAVTREKGFCPQCGTPYDFVARLKAGDMIAGKYEIKGPVAFGGLGWIYLGWDTVLQRWVVLKGLLNANDEASAAAAVAERRYLAAVKHPKIVGIYDFVNQGAEGFIIMEYVGGRTVHSLRKERGPLPVTEAIAYILGIFPAFAYLHAQGLVYCDFKPDNVMVEEGDVKLIDMGAVRKIGDPNGDIYATVGFAAPEADQDPVAVSDLYTLGRALAVLVMDFKFSSTYQYSLPSPDEQAVLADNESFYRFLLRATHTDPDERFQSADEMQEQLFGVLREIVSLQSGPKPVDSKVFSGDRMVDGGAGSMVERPDPASLPTLRVNLQDPGANEVIRILSGNDVARQIEELSALVDKLGDKATEPRLRLVEVLIASHQDLREKNSIPQNKKKKSLKSNEYVESLLQKVEQNDPFDWRSSWYRGVYLLTQNQGQQALAQFERCYFEMPGELAPRLAMGMAAEMAGHYEQALPYYDRVGQVDPGYVTAHAGAARCLAHTGDLPQALAMLQRVPSTHALYGRSQLAAAELVLAHQDRVNPPLLRQAGSALAKVLPDGGAANQVAGRVYALALELLKKTPFAPNDKLMDTACTEVPLRSAAEDQFRKAAKQAPDLADRVRWVQMANAVRPRTFF